MLMFGSSKLLSGVLFLGLVVSASCSRTGKEMAKAEESCMMARYKDKMDRPSPPAMTSSQVGNARVSIDYSQPGVKGRQIWGDLVKFNKIWRTGANEANVLETSAPLLVNGDTIPTGKFSLFAIPTPTDWTVVINKVYDQWGVYDYNPSEDVARLTVRPVKVGDLQERMTFDIDSTGKIEFSWEYLRFNFKVQPL
ncbi:MAG: DUF2911 domain-containing protein [Cyclobacteriaceae bacterium]